MVVVCAGWGELKGAGEWVDAAGVHLSEPWRVDSAPDHGMAMLDD